MEETSCYKVLKNVILGRHLVAGRNIKRGELILKEKPLFVGAPISAFLTCFKCNAIISNRLFPCPECETAILCSKLCSGDNHPIEECSSLKNNFKLRDLVERTQIIMPLRCLLLRHYKKDVWCELLKLESHLDKRQNTWIWRNHQINVQQVLSEIGAIGEDDIKENLVQKICGILDVNSFEIRPPEQNTRVTDDTKKYLRGLYLRAALITHDCVGNTHLAVDDNFCLTVHASTDIPEGEIIYFNYSNALLGTHERKEHLREGKYFECTCKRCEDPTEFGTHLSSLICVRCPKGNVTPPKPFSGEIKWQCENCYHMYSGSMIKSTISECKRIINDLDFFNVQECERVLKKLQRTLTSRHYLILEIKQNLIASYSSAFPSIKNLHRKIELCEDLLKVFEILEPGISRIQAITLYELSTTKLELCRKMFNEQELTEEEFCGDLLKCEAILKKAISYLVYEPTNSPEGRLNQQALCDLRSLRNNIKQLTIK